VPRCRVYSDLPTARGQPTRHEREGAGVSSPVKDFREHVFSETHSHKTSTSESHVPPRRVRKSIDRVRAYRRSRSQQGVAEAFQPLAVRSMTGTFGYSSFMASKSVAHCALFV
jgi:hypothetical protein